MGILALAAILLAGIGSFSLTSRHDVPQTSASALGPAAAATPGPARPPVPANALGSLASRTPALARLQAALNRGLAMAGSQAGLLVYDLDARHQLFTQDANVGRPPASVEKLYTTVALMRRLGPDTRLHTTVLGSGHQVRGVWRGNLYLRGGGDPTFGDTGFNQFWNHGYGTTPNQLAVQLRRRGIKRVTGHVFADESLFDRLRGGLSTGYRMDTPDFGGSLSALTYDHGTATKRLSPALFADREFVYTLRDYGISARMAGHDGKTPKDAHLLADVASPPLAVLTRLMDVPSDDLYAEMLTKQLGVLFGGGGSIAAGARVIRSTLADTYGLHPKILDGSGLSHRDGSSPEQIVDLLRDVWHTTTGSELDASLPTVGKQGTVQGIGVKTAASGRCIAKTGTLDSVTNLAGYCRSLGGHTLAFAMMVDGPPNWTATVIESRMIGAIAAY